MTKVRPSEMPKRLARLPIIGLAMLSLVTGVWGGLVRLPVTVPLPTEHANWLTYHGPLMVCGFLGTLIGLERAVGLRYLWTYLAPLVTGVGAVLLVGGFSGRPAIWLITIGSALFLAVTIRVVMLQPVLFTVTMMLGAATWLGGNVLWLWEWEIPGLIPWWIAFLCLTIVGERLDLSRFQRLPNIARPLFLAATAVFLSGVFLSAWKLLPGQRITGVGLIGLSLWLARFDIARRTIRQPGLPRFMAACLLGGYVWLFAAGVMLLLPLAPGTTYDAALHSFFLGFVFAMIFGHAPVIFPAVLLLPAAFSPRFYIHLMLLHLSLLLRVIADLTEWIPGRQWGASLNGLAILVFLVSTITTIALAARSARPAPK